MNPIENVWNIIKKVIGDQISCKKEEMTIEYATHGIV